MIRSVLLAPLLLLELIAFPCAAEEPPQYVARWGLSGTEDGRFDLPIHIAVDGQGSVYVTDYRNERIQRFSGDGAFLNAWFMPGRWQGGDHFSRSGPMGLGIAPDGSVLVSTSESRVRRYSSDGIPLAIMGGGYGAGNGQLSNPQGVAADPSGNVYVADAGNNRVVKFSEDGVWLANWGSQGGGNGQFDRPRDIVVNGSGRILVSDDTGRIQTLTDDGEFVDSFQAVTGPGRGLGAVPGMGLDALGNVFVTDAAHNRVRKFSSSGALLSEWGEYGEWSPGDFNGPLDVAVDPAGAIYVTDSRNNRIQKFAPCTEDCVEISRPCAETTKLALHAMPAIKGDACPKGQIRSCADIVTEGDVRDLPTGAPYYVYILVHIGDAETISGLQCGITYQDGEAGAEGDHRGVDILSWQLCATLQFATTGAGGWPEPGGGNMMTWQRGDCQAEATAVAGYFYVAAYSEDRLSLIPRPVDGQAKVARCENVEIPLSSGDLGYISFSSGSRTLGCNPARGEDCSVTVPVEATTWSSIKTMYR